ncbi:unnamed protein product, partial [marine sediment metagenome]
TGVTGVCWNVKIMALQFICYGYEPFWGGGWWGEIGDAIDAVNYAVEMGADVLSNSWGGGEMSQGLKDTIQAANEAGVLFIAAAGNAGSNTDWGPYYPSSYDCENIIAVMATDHDDLPAFWSNYGKTAVDLSAPGVDIERISL